MRDIQKEKDYFFTRLDHFIDRIERSKNEFDIEAHVNSIRQLAEKVHERMHQINSKSLNPLYGGFLK